MLHLYDQKGFDEWIAKLSYHYDFGLLPRGVEIVSLCGSSSTLDLSFSFSDRDVDKFTVCPACQLVGLSNPLDSYLLSCFSIQLLYVDLDAYDLRKGKYYRMRKSLLGDSKKLPGDLYPLYGVEE